MKMSEDESNKLRLSLLGTFWNLNFVKLFCKAKAEAAGWKTLFSTSDAVLWQCVYTLLLYALSAHSICAKCDAWLLMLL